MPLLTTVIENRTDGGSKSYSLLVIGPDVLASQPLPQSGTLTIGRADNAEVKLADPLASRVHARLHIGAGGTIEIEDLGSINSTRVRDVTLTPGARVAIMPGEAVTIGSTMLMVQESRDFSRPRRVWPHAYFEARLEEEVARSQDTRAPFAAVRLHVANDPGPMAVADAVAAGMRLPDMLAVYGPGEYEILLPNTTPELAGAMVADLLERLRARGSEGRTGIACYPRDGRTPELLVSLACDRVRVGTTRKSNGVVEPVVPVIQDPAMRRVHHLAQRAAVGNINILIAGETGVGKEVMAETIHRLSPRGRAPFLCLNCAALAATLLESELFGHERGAFTGATEAKPGLLETAPGGTIFLDEIGEMPLAMQAKLLRVIESRQVTRVGGLKVRSIDVRFLAATNRNLEAEVAEGRFRRDLYFRLNGFMLQIPPLRERRSEIMPLAHMFLGQMSADLGRSEPPAILPETEALLLSYAWPGNIRELRNMMERALLLSVGDEITPDCLPADTMAANCPRPAPPPVAPGARPVPAAPESERDRIVRALAENAGNQSRAARTLGMARSTLIEKLKTYQIPRPRPRA